MRRFEVTFDHDAATAIRDCSVRDRKLAMRRVREAAAHFLLARAGIAVLRGASCEQGGSGREADETYFPGNHCCSVFRLQQV